MTEPRWLSLDEILTAHDKQLVRFGGASGVRDRGALESAVDRPRNKSAYGENDLVTLAAAYAFGLARNHPFVDGNKRVAFVAMVAFLRLNKMQFAPPQAEATAAILGLAAGEISEDSLARWIRDRIEPPTK